MGRTEDINKDLLTKTPICVDGDNFHFEPDDEVNNPSHYQSYQKDGIDCITAMKHAFGETAVAHFCIGNAFKYLFRHGSKGGFTDIRKAIWYLKKYEEIGIIEMGD